MPAVFANPAALTAATGTVWALIYGIGNNIHIRMHGREDLESRKVQGIFNYLASLLNLSCHCSI
jgi:hypothetical protein